MKLTVKQLRDKVLKEAAKVVDLGARRAEKTRRWEKVGTYSGTGVPGSIDVEVSNNGELALMMDEMHVILSTVDTAAFLDHVRRALDSQ
jgi:hypothetical protein